MYGKPTYIYTSLVGKYTIHDHGTSVYLGEPHVQHQPPTSCLPISLEGSAIAAAGTLSAAQNALMLGHQDECN